MSEPSDNGVGTCLRQGAEQLRLRKVPDRFTARLRRDVTPEHVAASYRVDHSHSFARQRIEEFAVDAALRDTVMDRARDGNEVQFASHVYSLESDPASRLYLTDEITVQFKPEVTDDQIEGVAAEHGLTPVKAVDGLARTFVFRVNQQAKENPIKISNRLAASRLVVTAEPNVVVAARRRHVPTDNRFSQQWHLHNSGGVFVSPAAHIDAVRAWDVERGERSVIVAVIDDSVDLHHDDFQGAGKVVAARDFAGIDFEPLPEGPDDNHGTACAGVAVAEENGQGVVGVAPGCALMPIRMGGGLDDTTIEDMFAWAVDHGASVISCSWGAAAKEFPLSLRKQNALHRAATLGRGGRGCVIVFAAGNSNRPVNGMVDEKGWPNNLYSGPTRWLDGFSSHGDVVAVAACTSEARKAAYSNWGKEVAVCAPSSNGHPGTSIYTPQGWVDIATYPEITSPMRGLGIVTTDRVGPSGYSSADYTDDFGGTSSACPVVAGVAALLLSANPDLTAQEVKAILQQTADKIVDNGFDAQLGTAFGTYDQDGHSPWFGHGKINAFQAVQEALRRAVGPGQDTIRKASTPALDIPDPPVPGVRDEIQISQPGVLAALRVHVDVTHTYIGDLRITLTAPSGQVVVLHDRRGGGTKNLHQRFDATSTPGLALLAGQAVQGEWTLHVQDLAAIDLGRLNLWELELDIRQDNVVDLVDAPGLTIPDNRASGVKRTLMVPGTSAVVKRVEVSLDITHTYIGDLVVALVSPSGTRAALHHRAGGQGDNIITTYTPATTPALQTLQGEPAAGIWTLEVADLEAVDVGKLNRWQLRVAT